MSRRKVLTGRAELEVEDVVAMKPSVDARSEEISKQIADRASRVLSVGKNSPSGGEMFPNRVSSIRRQMGALSLQILRENDPKKRTVLRARLAQVRRRLAGAKRATE